MNKEETVKIYKSSKATHGFFLLCFIWLGWNAWGEFSEGHYVDALISTCVTILCLLWLVHIFSLRVAAKDAGISISTRFKSHDEISWQNIKAVKLSKYVIWGKPDIHIIINDTKQKIIIPRYIARFSQLLKVIVNQASNAEIDARVNKYL